jgi:exopolysaccharide production protein ExoF
MRARLALPFLAPVFSLAVCFAGSAASADAYRVAAGDHLHLKILEWRADRGEPYEWPGFAGDYIVGADGALALPIVGFVPAEEKTVADLATGISALLQKQTGLAHSLQISLEIVQYRPCYVFGNVDKPGEYPFRPNLTVLEAVSLAGGAYRGPQNKLQLERDAIEARGAQREHESERTSLLASQARLLAEVSDAAQVAFPDELNVAGDRRSAAAKQVQLQLFDSHRTALKAKLQAFDEEKRLSSSEIDTLTKKMHTVGLQEDLNQSELDSIDTLRKKGLTTEPRKIALEQNREQLQSTRLDYELSIVRAQRDIATAERDKGDALTTRKNDALTELATVETEIAQNEEKRATAVRLAEQAEASLTRAQGGLGDRANPLVFAVQRKGVDHPILVSETDALQPGDVLKVSDSRANGLSN